MLVGDPVSPLDEEVMLTENVSFGLFVSPAQPNSETLTLLFAPTKLVFVTDPVFVAMSAPLLLQFGAAIADPEFKVQVTLLLMPLPKLLIVNEHCPLRAQVILLGDSDTPVPVPVPVPVEPL